MQTYKQMKKKNNQSCRCCHSEVNEIFSGYLIGNNVRYFECSSCGYIQTEMPYWLDQAYAEAINDSDTGIMVRNQDNASIVLVTMWMLGKLNGILVDCAGGYGILVRLMRDFGVNALWSDRYCKNMLARGFEHSDEKADLVSAFEAFEHFINPAEELDRLLALAPNVLFSTELIAVPAPNQDDWWYYGKEHGQHIGFFRISTLKRLAKDRGKYFVSNGTSYHLITDKPVNQLLWKVFIRLKHILPIMLKHKLISKVMKDHHLIAERKV
jgi:hypothetical protein